MSKLILTRMDVREVPSIVTALYEGNRMAEVRVQREESRSILGNIYIGKVEKIARNISAAFVMISPSQRCYLQLSETVNVIYASGNSPRHELQTGDEILVQVSREAMKAKLPAVRTNLNFTGEYLVLTSGDRTVGYSGKISAGEKVRLKCLLESRQEILDEERTFGIIVRTNAANASEEEILKEFHRLYSRYRKVTEQGIQRRCFSCVDENLPSYMETVRDVRKEDLEEIVTDQKDLFEQIGTYLCSSSQSGTSVRFYEDRLQPLSKLLSMEKQLEDALKEKVWMASGGFLIIQQTEACVVIDVNTGRFEGKKKAEETYRKINREAAIEITRQIRLRNLSGIILIDFINMENPDHEEELFHVMKNAMKQDPLKGKVVDITPLHIMELTRKKIRRPLSEEVLQIRSKKRMED